MPWQPEPSIPSADGDDTAEEARRPLPLSTRIRAPAQPAPPAPLAEKARPDRPFQGNEDELAHRKRSTESRRSSVSSANTSGQEPARSHSPLSPRSPSFPSTPPRRSSFLSQKANRGSLTSVTESGTFLDFVVNPASPQKTERMSPRTIVQEGSQGSDEELTASRSNLLGTDSRASMSGKVVRLSSEGSMFSFADSIKDSIVSRSSNLWEGLRKGRQGLSRLAGRAALGCRSGGSSGFSGGGLAGAGAEAGRRSSRGPHERKSLEQDFAAQLVGLALAVCAATAAECLELAEAASPAEQKALSQLEGLASRAGLMHRMPTASGVSRHGPTDSKEFSRSFVELQRIFEAPEEAADWQEGPDHEATGRRKSIGADRPPACSERLAAQPQPRPRLRGASPRGPASCCSSCSPRFAGSRQDAQDLSDADESGQQASVSPANPSSKRASVKWDGLVDSSKGLGSWPVTGSATGSRGMPAHRSSAYVSQDIEEGRWRPRTGSVAASSFSVSSFTDFNRRKAPFQISSGRGADAGWRHGSAALGSGGLGGRRAPTLLESLLGGSGSPLALARLGTAADRGQSPTASSHIGRLSFSNPPGEGGEGGEQMKSRRGSGGGSNWVMEIDIPAETSAGRAMTQFRYPNQEHAVAVSEAGSGDSAAQTYYSACDAVLQGTGGEREAVRAEVVNFSQGAEGLKNSIRIEFQSQCLRTQNAWQRQLLAQQQSLLDNFRSTLEDAQREMKLAEEVSEEEKELLRGFRKIVTRQVDSAEEVSRVEVFVVERSRALCNELTELCKILEYPCQAFTTLAAATDAMELVTEEVVRQPNFGTDRPESKKTARNFSSYENSSVGSTGYSRGSSDESPTSRPSSATRRRGQLLVMLLGWDWLDREIPRQWRERGVSVSLTSRADEFEEVGRALLASGEAEIRSALRAKGICEYLLHPLSLESLRQVVVQAARRRFGDEYLLTKVIGRGAFGIVYRAKRLRDGAVLALKEINTQRGRLPQEQIGREGEILHMLEWPTIVQLLDTWVASSESLLYLLMPLLDGGDLAMRIAAAAAESGAGPPATDAVCDWYAQALHGVSYLHWRGVLHQDLKPGNLLLASDERALQISDLGNAATLPGPGPHPARRSVVKSRASCTLLYASPEVLLQDVHMAASDAWSLGVSFYEVLTLQPLFPPDTPLQLLRERAWGYDQELAVEALRERAAEGGPERSQLAGELSELLRRDPLRRPLAATLLKRPGTAERLRAALFSGAAPKAWLSPQGEAHFQLLQRVISESEAAADVDPPSEEATYRAGRDYPAEVGGALRRRSRGRRRF